MSLRNLSILILTPDEEFFGKLENILKSGEIEIIQRVTDTYSLNTFLDDNRVDFVLLEDALPDVDGVAYTRDLRNDSDKESRGVNLFLFSGNMSIGRSIDAVNAGVHEFFSKTVDAERLLSRIHANFVDPRSFIENGNYVGPDRRRAAKSSTRAVPAAVVK